MKKALILTLTIAASLFAGLAFAAGPDATWSLGTGKGVYHTVDVKFPKFVLLHVAATAHPATVAFDFTTANGLTAYTNALKTLQQGGSPTPIGYGTAGDASATTLTKVEGLTSASTATVTVTIEDGGSFTDNVQLNSNFAGSQTSIGTYSLDINGGKWQTIVTRQDFSVLPDPADMVSASATSATHTYTVTYTAVAN